jgi:hypothetical protein
MQLFCECASGISVKVNSAALPENRQPIAHGTLRSVQESRDHTQFLVASKIEQNSVIILGPRMTITLRTPLCNLPNEVEFCGSPPDQVRAPVGVAPQQLPHCFSLSSRSILVPVAQDLLIFFAPYRTAILWSGCRILELPNALPQIRSL